MDIESNDKQIKINDKICPVISVPYSPTLLKMLIVRTKKINLINVFPSNSLLIISLSIFSNKNIDVKYRKRKFNTLNKYISMKGK